MGDNKQNQVFKNWYRQTRDYFCADLTRALSSVWSQRYRAVTVATHSTGISRPASTASGSSVTNQVSVTRKGHFVNIEEGGDRGGGEAEVEL